VKSDAGARLPTGAPDRDAEPEAIVYVVDDDLSVRRALSRLLRSVGLAVETFSTAQAFLDSVPRDQPACLVLDVRLPGPSGLDLQSALREAGRPLPIIFITGHGSVSTSVRAMKGGAVDFLQKPFNDQDLLDCIQRALATIKQLEANGGTPARKALDAAFQFPDATLVLFVSDGRPTDGGDQEILAHALNNVGTAELLGGTPEAATAYVRAEIEKWAKVVKFAKMRVE